MKRWQTILAGLGALSLIGTGANAGSINGPVCSDSQNTWDTLYGQISEKLQIQYGSSPGFLASVEQAMLGARPECPDTTTSITPLGLGADLTDLVLNTALNDPPPWSPVNNPSSWDFGGVVITALSPFEVVTVVTDDPPTSIPEPTSLALFGSGIVGFLALRRRRRGRFLPRQPLNELAAINPA